MGGNGGGETVDEEMELKEGTTHTSMWTVLYRVPLLAVQTHQDAIAENEGDPHEHIPDLRHVFSPSWFHKYERH